MNLANGQMSKRIQATNSSLRFKQKNFQDFVFVLYTGWLRAKREIKLQTIFDLSVFESPNDFFLCLWALCFPIQVSDSRRSINDYHCKSSRFEAKHNNYNAHSNCARFEYRLTHKYPIADTHTLSRMSDSIAIDTNGNSYFFYEKT